MKKQCTAIGFALFMVFAFPPVTGEDAALTNEDIVRLSQAGLGAEVIIREIKASAAKFDTSVEQLLELKGADVEDSVIAAMVNKGAAAPLTNPAASTAPAPAAAPEIPRRQHAHRAAVSATR